MGLAGRDQGARRKRCRCTSWTTSNAEIARQPPCALRVPAARGICGVGAPRRCTETSPASRRLASAPAALGTRPLLIFGWAPRINADIIDDPSALIGGHQRLHQYAYIRVFRARAGTMKNSPQPATELRVGSENRETDPSPGTKRTENRSGPGNHPDLNRFV
jgi:hypothetical protein